MSVPRASGPREGRPARGRIATGLARYAALTPERPKPARAYRNWLRATWALARRPERAPALPLKLTLDPTNVCQLRCPLCPTGLGIIRRTREHADLEAYRRLLDELGPDLFVIDLFNWGEPLLNPRLAEMVRIASAHGIATRLSTNLSLPLADERIEELVASGLGELAVSIDGTSPESYGEYRRRGDLSLVLDNLERFVAARRRLGRRAPWIVWKFLVFRFNEDEREEAVARARAIGVDRILFDPAALEHDRYPLDDAQRETVRGWAPRAFAVASSPEATAAEEERLRSRGRCDWHYVSAAINADGSVAPCCGVWEPADDLGTVDGTHRFADIWNGAAYRAIRARLSGTRAEPTGQVCDRCPVPRIMPYAPWVHKDIVALSVVRAARRLGWLRR